MGRVTKMGLELVRENMEDAKNRLACDLTGGFQT